MPYPLSRRSFLHQATAASLLSRVRIKPGQQQTHPGTNSSTPAGMHPAMHSGSSATGRPPVLLHPLELTPFVDAMPLPQLLAPRQTTAVSPLRITMREIHAQVHRDVPPTRMWSYGPAALAPVIEARSHQPLHIRWANDLPAHHFLPIDHSLHGCGRDLPEVRACVHVHGARVPSHDDGQPDDWYVPGVSRTCLYPLAQDATALWYHDHAMGLNRLNIYAGLFGMLLVRDHVEDNLNLPRGPYEIPLILYDREFTADGQLFYPTSGDPEHPWVPEFVGDALLVNGKIRPYVEVEPRLYRLRVLNASNSRFFSLSLSNGLPLHQIGSDQGLLAAPVELHTLTLAPAERADILIDLSGAAGQTITLNTGALAILQLRVGRKTLSPVAPPSIPTRLRTLARTPESAATVTRTITLNEYQDNIGNSVLMLLNRKHWHEPVTERPRLNTTEIWEFVNLTEDTHPMHIHLVRFQILDRRAFDTFTYLKDRQLRFVAAATAPAPNELGWKDTVQCSPGAITRVIVRFEGYTGRYLYHCHILEHEANDMMRPFEVIT